MMGTEFWNSVATCKRASCWGPLVGSILKQGRTTPGGVMKAIILTLFLLSSSLAGSVLAQTAPSADPQPDPRIAQLETVLNRVQQEQQSVYQEFQMTQELRRNEIQEGHPLIVQGSAGMGGVRTRLRQIMTTTFGCSGSARNAFSSIPATSTTCIHAIPNWASGRGRCLISSWSLPKRRFGDDSGVGEGIVDTFLC